MPKKLKIIAILFASLLVIGFFYFQREGSDLDGETVLEGSATDSIPLNVESVELEDLDLIPTCENRDGYDLQKPNEAVQSQLGIMPLLDDGYEMVDICQEADGGISFLLAKNEPNLLYEGYGVDPNCLNRCDRVAFGFLNAEKQDPLVFVLLSDHRLGIHAESYNHYCSIDSFELTDDLSNTKLYFYCGTGENNGYTDWYVYNFVDDELEVAQRMIQSIPSEVFDVKDSDLLSKFRYHSNAEIRQSD